MTWLSPCEAVRLPARNLHRKAFRREPVTGFLVSLLLAAVIFPLVLLRWGRADVATAVALAVVSACSIASGVAVATPWLLRWFGHDPAFAAAPLASLIQDLLSVLVYMLVCLAKV